jgi:O-antigen ligase
VAGLSAISFWKNTAFLVLVVTLAYLWAVEWRFRYIERKALRAWSMVAVMVLVALGAAALILASPSDDRIMPSGNPEFRLRTYQGAWDRFGESPAWGTLFTGPAVEEFKAYAIHGDLGVVLPSHSDLLDLAANGGCIGLALWLWAYVRAGRIARRHVLAGRARDELAAAAHAFACMSICGVLVYAFNPIMLQPPKAMLLWTHAGFLLGIALHVQAQARTGARQGGAVSPSKASTGKPGVAS